MNIIFALYAVSEEEKTLIRQVWKGKERTLPQHMFISQSPHYNNNYEVILNNAVAGFNIQTRLITILRADPVAMVTISYDEIKDIILNAKHNK